MQKNMKKLMSLVVATLLCGATLSLAGCSDYTPKKSSPVSGDVTSNGGFAVEKGDYVYFINGNEDYTADNTTGKVTKGALYRTNKNDLAQGKYDTAECIVPVLFVSENYNAGIYIYGDYVYFASPTTEKSKDGSVSNDWISFKKAKIDGSSTEKEINSYFFRSESRNLQYRFVEENGVVYLLHVTGTELYSYNTKSGKDTLLVKGASNYYFDTTDNSNGTVYYTMGVTYAVDSEHPQSVTYNQIYSVEADATATVNKSETSYTTSYDYTYSFDGKYLEKNVSSFKASDYTTYPYVNLGKLVLDGKGSDTETYPESQYNHDTTTPATANGYTYTIQSYQNGGLYFTRSDVKFQTMANLYFAADSQVNATSWKSIEANASLNKIADSTANASSSAIFTYDESTGKHTYYYVNDSKIFKQVVGEATPIMMTPDASGAKLWTVNGDYLYYTNGSSLYRINATGTEAKNYSGLNLDEEYKPIQILDIKICDGWYKPEFVGNTLLYCNDAAYGSDSYEYVNAVNLNGASGMMKNTEIKALNEKLKEVNDFMSDLTDESSDYEILVKAMKYYYYTGETTVYDDFLKESVEKGYSKYYQYSKEMQNEFDAFTKQKAVENGITENDYSAKFKDENGKFYTTESYFYSMLGEMKAKDEEALNKVWASDSFVKPLPVEKTEEAKAWPVWVDVVVIAGVVLVVAAATVCAVLFIKKGKNSKKNTENEKVSRIKIDTTDDKSIDVYATEEPKTEEAKVETVEEEKGE